MCQVTFISGITADGRAVHGVKFGNSILTNTMEITSVVAHMTENDVTHEADSLGYGCPVVGRCKDWNVLGFYENGAVRTLDGQMIGESSFDELGPATLMQMHMSFEELMHGTLSANKVSSLSNDGGVWMVPIDFLVQYVDTWMS